MSEYLEGIKEFTKIDQGLQLENPATTKTLSEPQFLFLGTSAMTATRTRNCSSNLLFINEGAILIDCGPGTYSQIYDHFGGNQA